MAVPTNEPRSVIVGLIESNMASLGSWTPTVNDGWFVPKNQKTYQISISPGYSEVMTPHMDDAASVPRVVHTFFIIHLFAPSRANLWSLYTATANVLNTRSLVQGGVNSDTDYRYIKIARSDETKAMETFDKECDMPPGSGDNGCLGYRRDLTVCLVHHE